MTVLPHRAFYNASRNIKSNSNNNSIKLNSLLNLNSNIYNNNCNHDENQVTATSLHPQQSISTVSLHSLKQPPIHFNSNPYNKQLSLKNYKLSSANLRFCCFGNLLTSKDNPSAFIASVILILGLPAIFFGRVAVDLWFTLSPAVAIIAAYLTLLVWSSMIKTAFSDPGILPVNIDRNSLDTLPKDVTIRDGLVRVKYCDICQLVRPPRASHCRLCNSCIDGIDHHCSFLNICIGRRNYPSFLVFCLVTTVTLIYYAVFAAIHIWQLTKNTRVSDDQSFKQSLQQDPASAVIFLLSIILLIPISLLLAYHTRVSFLLNRRHQLTYTQLVIINSTTIEQLRSKALSKAQKSDTENSQNPFTTDLNGSNRSNFNPFSHKSYISNILWMAFRPGSNYSYVNFNKHAYTDSRKPNSEAN